MFCVYYFPSQAADEQTGLEMNEVNQEPVLRFLYSNTDAPKDSTVSLLQRQKYCVVVFINLQHSKVNMDFFGPNAQLLIAVLGVMHYGVINY